MIVKVNHNDKFLAKKVLLSVVAAGVMTGFVMNAEAAEGKFSENQVFNKTNVTYEKVNASGKANVTLTNGVVTGLKESRFDPDDPEDAGRTHADVATEIRDAGTRVEANNIAFTGEVSAVEGSNVIINGGSVTAGNAYYDAAHGNKVEKLATEIGAHDGATIELNKVKIDSNLGAFDGGVVTVNDSSVNAAFAIYAEGKGTINLISTDGKATYTASGEGVEAVDGGVININGGGTLHTTNISVEGNGSKFITDGSVEAQKIVAGSNASVILNGGGKITGYKYDDGNTLAASVTGNSTLTAANVDFTGDFKAKEGSKIILKGGSVTASDYYENGKKDGYTEFGAIGENSSIEADGVDIKSATLATDGAKVTIKNSNINTVEGIWAARKGTINLDGKATYTASGEGVEAVDGGVINISGGGTLHTTNISVEGNGSKFVTDGSVEAKKIAASSNANVTLNGGKISGWKEERQDDQEPDVAFADIATDVSDGSTLQATKVDFTGGIEASGRSKIILNGGSVTAGQFYDKANKPLYSTEIGADGATIELNKVKIDSNLGAFDGGVITVSDSNVNADTAIFASGKGAVINLNSSDGKATYTVGEDGVEAVDGGVININGGGTLHTTNISVEDNGSKFITDGSVEAQKIVAGSNASVILNGGGKITGAELPSGTKVAATVTGNSTLTATNVDFTGDFKAEGGSKIVLKGGSVTASDYYENGKKDGYTEFGAIGENSIIKADGVDIKSATLAKDGATVTIKNSNINTVEGIWAWNEKKGGQGSEIVLDGTAANVYTVGESIVAYNGSKIYINGGTLKDDNLKSKMFGIETEDGTINTDAKGIVLDKNGVISTMSDQIYANAASATQKKSGAITNEGIDFKGGSLILNDAKFTQSYTDSAQAELKKQGVTKLTMNGELVKEETGEVKTEISVGEAADKFGSDTELDKVTAKADNNLLVGSNDASLAGKDVAGINVKQQVGNGFAVGKLDLGAGSDGMVITNGKEVTLGGSQGGSVITVNGADKDVKVVVGTDDHANPVAGATEIIGHLNIGNALATSNTQYNLNGEVIVNDASTLKTNGQVEVTDSITLVGGRLNAEKGSLNTDKLIVDKIGDLAGKVGAKKLELIPGSSLNSALNIGDDNGAGKLTVDEIKLNGGSILLDPVWREGTTISDASGLAVKNITTVDGKYIVGRNSVLSLGADLATAESVFAKTEQTWGENDVSAAAYIASTINVTNGSLIVDGSRVDYPTTAVANGSVNFADKSLLMVDGEKTKTTVAITGVTDTAVADSSKLYIDNAKNGETYKIIAGSENGWKKENVISNNKLLKFNIENSATHDAYDVTAYSDSVKEAYGSAIFAGDVYDAAILAGGVAAEFVNSASDDHNNADDATKASALNSAAAMGELAGVEHGTYAASNLFTDAISEHMSLTNEKEHDSDIWAKYIHSKENVDGLAVAGADSKYDVNYNGIVVGADLYKNGKATVGAALSYVDGSIKGNTLAARTEDDATYYGASVYGGIQNEDSAVIGDISYLHGKNDITQHNSGMTLTADAKSDAFSIGVRAEKTLKAGVGKFVPYAGIRYMHLGTGNYNNSIGMSYDGDDMNLWLLPVGVKYSADVKAGGWTIRPIAEVGYVWNMGDRDATQTVSLNGASNGFGYDVADNGSYIGRFVVEAEKANVTYGLGYEYQKGDSVKANKWMANVNWSF